MAYLNFAESASQNNGGNVIVTILVYGFLIAILVFFYFSVMRPQKQEEKRRKALLETIAIGDSVVTTAGFYGVVIDMIDEQGIVVVEFGNNKNCRIPMKKAAITEVEKAAK